MARSRCFMISQSVDPGELRAGANTVTFEQTGMGRPQFTNVQLVWPGRNGTCADLSRAGLPCPSISRADRQCQSGTFEHVRPCERVRPRILRRLQDADLLQGAI